MWHSRVKCPSYHSSVLCLCFPSCFFVLFCFLILFISFVCLGDFVSVSSPEGNFKLSKLQEVEDLFLLAAGTGFTPMVNVLNYALTCMSSLRYVPFSLITVTQEALVQGIHCLW